MSSKRAVICVFCLEQALAYVDRMQQLHADSHAAVAIYRIGIRALDVDGFAGGT